MLQKFGNPGNMGICVACFDRDIAGAIGLHRADVVQYLRPEILGFGLGAFVSALLFKEFKPRGGSSPFVRFFLGMIAMIGALVFLGCPWRVILRLAGGDGNALFGLAGLVVGVGIGTLFFRAAVHSREVRKTAYRSRNAYSPPVSGITGFTTDFSTDRGESKKRYPFLQCEGPRIATRSPCHFSRYWIRCGNTGSKEPFLHHGRHQGPDPVQAGSFVFGICSAIRGSVCGKPRVEPISSRICWATCSAYSKFLEFLGDARGWFGFCPGGGMSW